MNPRTVIILWITAMILGITAYAVKFHSTEPPAAQTKLRPGDKLFADIPVQQLASISIQQGEHTTTISRSKANQWTVNERGSYPANHELLRNLIGALGELQVTQGFPCGTEHYERFGVETPNPQNKNNNLGLRVSMQDASGNTVAELFLGKFNRAQQQATGRFVRINGDDSGVYTVAETFPGVYAEPPVWLDKQFITVQNIQSIALSAPANSNFTAWKLAKPSASPKSQFQLADMQENEVMKLASTGSLRNLLAITSFQDVLSPDRAAATANPDISLKRQLRITTFDGITFNITYQPQLSPPPAEPDPESPLPPVQAAYLVTVDVEAQLAEKRPAVEGETAEQRAKNDALYGQRLIRLKKFVGVMQSFRGRIYQVGHTAFAPLQKSRGDFVAVKK